MTVEIFEFFNDFLYAPVSTTSSMSVAA